MRESTRETVISVMIFTGIMALIYTLAYVPISNYWAGRRAENENIECVKYKTILSLQSAKDTHLQRVCDEMTEFADDDDAQVIIEKLNEYQRVYCLHHLAILKAVESGDMDSIDLAEIYNQLDKIEVGETK